MNGVIELLDMWMEIANTMMWRSGGECIRKTAKMSRGIWSVES